VHHRCEPGLLRLPGRDGPGTGPLQRHERVDFGIAAEALSLAGSSPSRRMRMSSSRQASVSSEMPPIPLGISRSDTRWAISGSHASAMPRSRCGGLRLGHAAYGLSWFDAHLWAYAECNGIRELISEDFRHGRPYGAVQVRNPFI
jgi:hypothetical protein